jgi:hypothetical protein
LLREGIDLGAADTEAAVRKVKLLTTAASYMNERLLDQYGG